jgi:hypothetical protein
MRRGVVQVFRLGRDLVMGKPPPKYITLVSLMHDPQLAAALGDMVVAWAAAETILITTLTQILGSNLNLIQVGYYRIPTFESRVKVINALIDKWEPKGFDKPAIKRAVTKLAKLASARNHWIHGNWCASEDFTETVIFDYRSSADSPNRRKPVKAADVENHTNAVRLRTHELLHLVDFANVRA